MLALPEGGYKRVVLKRMKRKIEGKEEMYHVEHFINKLVSRRAPECSVPYLGCTKLCINDDGSIARSEDLWLVGLGEWIRHNTIYFGSYFMVWSFVYHCRLLSCTCKVVFIAFGVGH